MRLPAFAETIVVGAGSAGCVIAARVTEDPSREVLLLEAGPDYASPDRLPSDLVDARRNSMRRHDWGLRHRPTTVQVPFPFPRGRVVGGSSAVNTCIALRGNPWDFDEWADRGLSAWSWEACLPAFRRLESDLDFDTPWHGTAGPLPVHRDPPEVWSPWQAAFVEAARDVGFPACPDSNAPGASGVGPHALNRVDGRRISAAEAWLTPTVRQRDNLTIAPGVTVARVLVRGGRAVGVEALVGRRVHRIEARRVVLAAGAVATPGVLLRSGIGPRAELDRLGVPLVRDLPVGRRLLDHPGYAVFFLPRPGAVRVDDPVIQTVLRYRGSGEDRANAMQLQPGSNVALGSFTAPVVTLMGHVGKPRGWGTLRLPSAAPLARPIITSRFLEDPHDRARAVEAMQLAHELAQRPAMARLARPLWPSAGVVRDRARAGAWIRHATDSGYHPCGTAPMGTEDDPDAVTDDRGRVWGVERLVVADASLMPTIPSGNIHLPTLMIAERLAGWLRSPP